MPAAAVEALEVRRLCSITVVAKKLALNVVGTSGDDTITVTAHRNLINVLNVSIVSAGGREDVSAVIGRFRTINVVGGDGNDSIRVENSLAGLAGDVSVWLEGGNGDDDVYAGPLGGTIRLNDGNDRARWEPGQKLYVHGEAGDDDIAASAGPAWIDGGSGNDVINGADGVQTISGGSGNDTIRAGTGAQTISGGSGNDTIAPARYAQKVDAGSGDDRVTVRSGNNQYEGKVTTVQGGDGRDTLTGAPSAENLMYGGPGDDVLVGDGGSNSLYGDAGDDVLDAGKGVHATLYGGDGDDDLYAGTYVGGGTYAYGQAGRDWFGDGFEPDHTDFKKKEDARAGEPRNRPDYDGGSTTSGSVVLTLIGPQYHTATKMSLMKDVGVIVHTAVVEQGSGPTFINQTGARPSSRPGVSAAWRKLVRIGVVRVPAGWRLENPHVAQGFVWYDVRFGKGGDRAKSTEFDTVYQIAVKPGTVLVSSSGNYTSAAGRIAYERNDVAAMWLPPGATARIAGGLAGYRIADALTAEAIKAPARQRGILVDGGVIWLPFENQTTRFVALP